MDKITNNTNSRGPSTQKPDPAGRDLRWSQGPGQIRQVALLDLPASSQQVGEIRTKRYTLLLGDCLKRMKKLPDNSVDSIVTDPPYFLINDSGGGFMGKTWDSINDSKSIDILCKSREYVQLAETFFMLMKVDSNMVEENIALSNVNDSNPIKKMSNVPSVEKNSKGTKATSKVNTNSVQGIVLTKGEVLDMLKELLSKNISVIESQRDDALFVIPYTLIRKQHKNTVLGNALKLPIKEICEEREIHLTLMGEAKIEDVIAGMTGKILEKEFINEMNITANPAESIVRAGNYRHIISNDINKRKIIRWIILLLYAINAIPKSKMEVSNYIVYMFHKNWSSEAYRVLKPGGYLLAFSGTRTCHRLMRGLEEAGFEIRDMIAWQYFSGFPKSLNIHKNDERCPEGWGTALKPALEPITLARKPLSEKTVAGNVLKWGTGGLNINDCRVSLDGEKPPTGSAKRVYVKNLYTEEKIYGDNKTTSSKGRYPANMIHDGSDEVLALLPNKKASQFFKACPTDENCICSLCYMPYTKECFKEWTANGVIKNLNQTGLNNDSVQKDVQDLAQQELEDNLENENNDVLSVEKPFMNTNQTKELTARRNVADFPGEQSVRFVKSVGNLCDSCAINIVQEVVEIKNWDSRRGESQVIRDFITDSKKYILLQNLVQYVEIWENIDTTPTTTNLLKLFGSALHVIKNYIQKIIKLGPKRLIYQSKASKEDRNEGLESLEVKGKVFNGQSGSSSDDMKGVEQKFTTEPQANNHPTVKPTALMTYLVRLVTPAKGTVLDPFMGSGSTGKACMYEKFKFIGIELDADYYEIAELRIISASKGKKRAKKKPVRKAPKQTPKWF